MTHHQWLLFVPAAMLVAASPGAGNFLALSNGLRGGALAAMIGLVGRVAAFAILISMVMIGVGAILSTSAIAFSALKWAGVVYLVWLGVRLWRSDTDPIAIETGPAGTPRQFIMREFTVALCNPKAMLLFTAFLPQFLVAGHPMAEQFTMLSAAYIMIEVAAASGYAVAGSRVKALHLSRRGTRRVNRITGGLMIAAAGWLATMRRAT
jgi:threonine/homoserine/homoserine lactone efflux protein